MTERTIIDRDAPSDHFTIIPNALIRDRRLSRFARSVLIEILSGDPNWRCTADDMWRRAQEVTDKRRGEGRDAYRHAFAEFEQHGYLTRLRSQEPDGRWTTILHFRSAPTPDSPVVGANRGNIPSSQVAPTPDSPAAGSPVAGYSGVKDLEVTPAEETLKDQKMVPYAHAPAARARRETMASGRARASSRAQIFTDQEKIDGTREAISTVYGDRVNKTVADKDALALFDAKKPKHGGRVTSVTAYMTRIFADTPELDTLLSQLDDDGTDTRDEYDLAREAEARPGACSRCKDPWQHLNPQSGICVRCEREDIINGRPVTGRPECPRCHNTRYAIGTSGVCAGCDAEIWSNPVPVEGWNQAILKSISKALFAATGKSVDDQWAASVAETILFNKNVPNPVRYVAHIIGNDKNPARFLPTPIPPRFCNGKFVPSGGRAA